MIIHKAKIEIIKSLMVSVEKQQKETVSITKRLEHLLRIVKKEQEFEGKNDSNDDTEYELASVHDIKRY